MRSAFARGLGLLGVAAALAVAGCGGLLDDLDLPLGRTCYRDSDCVPNGCCGRATTAIHELDAPSCAAVQCSGNCDSSKLACGCGLPVCQDGQCTEAFTVSAECPSPP